MYLACVEKTRSMGCEGVWVANRWILGLDVKVGEGTEVEGIVGDEFRLLADSHHLQLRASLEGTGRNLLEVGWQSHFFHSTVHKRSLSDFLQVVG